MTFKPGLKVISGCMFSGKTDELIRQVGRHSYANRAIQVFKPIIDNRYSLHEIVSHNGKKYEALPVETAESILASLIPDTQVVGIDEVQFFDECIVSVCEQLIYGGREVIVAGLPLDFRGEDFGQMPRLLARADTITKLDAICTVCGEDADRTQRMVNGKPAKYADPVILVGAKESYEARCRRHHEVVR